MMCNECRLKKIYSKGLCKSCYMKEYARLNPDTRKQLTVYEEEIDDGIVRVSIRIQPLTGVIGYTHKYTCKKHNNDISKKCYHNNSIEYNNRNKKYQKDNFDVLSEKSKIYRKNNPNGTFLGKRFKMVSHPLPPLGYVWHHTCYDHADWEANLVLLSRSSHMQGHHLLRKLGIEIPHINKEK